MNQQEMRTEHGLGTGREKGHSSDAVALSPAKDLCGLFWWDCALRVIEYHILVNMYHVSTQGVDEGMLNVHYYYYYLS